jgi:hypothetical protein
LLGDTDRVVQRQYGDGGRQTNASRPRRDIRQNQIGAGQHTERAEMMLADPGRMESHLLRLIAD